MGFLWNRCVLPQGGDRKAAIGAVAVSSLQRHMAMSLSAQHTHQSPKILSWIHEHITFSLSSMNPSPSQHQACIHHSAPHLRQPRNGRPAPSTQDDTTINLTTAHTPEPFSATSRPPTSRSYNNQHATSAWPVPRKATHHQQETHEPVKAPLPCLPMLW